MDFSNVNKFRRVIEFIREYISGDLALPQLAVYLTVCSEEGITMPELAEVLNMPQGSVSRNVKRLCKYEEGGRLQGYDLLTTAPDIRDRKRLAVYLTEQGKALATKLESLLN